MSQGTREQVIVPNSLRYNASRSPLVWGAFMLIAGQLALASALFLAIARVLSQGAGTGTTGFVTFLFVSGLLLSLAGLVMLMAGITNAAGNLDLVAWVTQHQLRPQSSTQHPRVRRAEAAGEDE